MEGEVHDELERGRAVKGLGRAPDDNWAEH